MMAGWLPAESPYGATAIAERMDAMDGRFVAKLSAERIISMPWSERTNESLRYLVDCYSDVYALRPNERALAHELAGDLTRTLVAR